MIIAGGGIGGLSAAAGLRSAGIDAAVFEQLDQVGATLVGGGFHLWPNAIRALRRARARRGCPRPRRPARGDRVLLLSGAQARRVAADGDRERPRPLRRRHRARRAARGAPRSDRRSPGDGRREAHRVRGRVRRRHSALRGRPRGARRRARRRRRAALDRPCHAARSGRARLRRLRAVARRWSTASATCCPRHRADHLRPRRANRHASRLRQAALLGVRALRALPTRPARHPAGSRGCSSRSDSGRRPSPRQSRQPPRSSWFGLPIYDRRPVEAWGRGGAPLLGDAAHPMTTNTSQGGNLAVEDGVVLAGELAERGRRGGSVAVVRASANRPYDAARGELTLDLEHERLGEPAPGRGPRADVLALRAP